MNEGGREKSGGCDENKEWRGAGSMREGEEGWVWGRARRGRGGGRRSKGAVSGHNLIRSSHSIS